MKNYIFIVKIQTNHNTNFSKKEIENTENLIGDGYKILEAFENTLDNLIELEDLAPNIKIY